MNPQRQEGTTPQAYFRSGMVHVSSEHGVSMFVNHFNTPGTYNVNLSFDLPRIARSNGQNAVVNAAQPSTPPIPKTLSPSLPTTGGVTVHSPIPPRQ